MAVVVRNMRNKVDALVSATAPPEGAWGWRVLLFTLTGPWLPEMVWVHRKARVRDLHTFLVQQWDNVPCVMGFQGQGLLEPEEVLHAHLDALPPASLLVVHCEEAAKRYRERGPDSCGDPSATSVRLRLRFLHGDAGVTETMVTCSHLATLATLSDMLPVDVTGPLPPAVSRGGLPAGTAGTAGSRVGFLVLDVATLSLVTDMTTPLCKLVGPMASLLFVAPCILLPSLGFKVPMVPCTIVLVFDERDLLPHPTSEHHFRLDGSARYMVLVTVLFAEMRVQEMMDLVAARGFDCPAACLQLRHRGTWLPPWTRFGDCPALASLLKGRPDQDMTQPVLTAVRTVCPE